MLEALWNNRIQAVSVILFAVGFVTLLLNQNLLKKVIGLNIMDTASYLFLTSIGYITGRTAPIITDTNAAVDAELYVNPLPAGLVLTGIVVSVSVTAVMLGLTLRLYARYHTLQLDKIYELVHKGLEEEEV